MWIDNPIFLEDMISICDNESVYWDLFREKSFLITGATGLIGQTVVGALAFANIKKCLHLKIYALVRNLPKARSLFNKQITDGKCIILKEGTIEDLPKLPTTMDYIVHGASITSSLDFVQHPVEVLQTAIRGTSNILEYAQAAQITKMVYLSSMEVYGYPQKGEKVKESEIGAFQPTVIRSSYPLSKQACENLCCAYASEYKVPVCIARLTQTFGPGVRYDDKRVFAEFARCAIEKKNIVLKTKGETERSYLYTGDAVSAIILLFTQGQSGEAYNVANENTYCSILQMAKTVAKSHGLKVCFDYQDPQQLGYASTLYMDLDTSKMKTIGWKPIRDLEAMYYRLILTMKYMETDC